MFRIINKDQKWLLFKSYNVFLHLTGERLLSTICAPHHQRGLETALTPLALPSLNPCTAKYCIASKQSLPLFIKDGADPSWHNLSMQEFFRVTVPHHQRGYEMALRHTIPSLLIWEGADPNWNNPSRVRLLLTNRVPCYQRGLEVAAIHTTWSLPWTQSGTMFQG